MPPGVTLFNFMDAESRVLQCGHYDEKSWI